MTRIGIVVALAVTLSGCSMRERIRSLTEPARYQRDQIETVRQQRNRAPGARGGETVDVSNLIEIRVQIPPIPTPPALPKVVPVNRETFANTGPVFQGTTRPLITEGKLAVAVIGRQELVGADSSAGKFVGDLLYAALQKRGVPLVDRDYRIIKRDEIGDFARPDGTMDGFIFLTESESQGFRIEGPSSLPAYIIVVHSVTIPNNPVAITLPLEIRDEDWRQYEGERKSYFAAVEEYNRAVGKYDTACREKAEFLSGSPSFVAGSVATTVLDELRDYIERHPSVRTYQLGERRAPPVSDMSKILGQIAGVQMGQASPELVDLYRRQMAIVPSGGYPAPFTPDFDRIYSSPEEILARLPHAQDMTVSAFQAAVSVRVIELKSSNAVWFGLGSAQNLNFAEAMTTAVDGIASNLILESD